jgi:autotransporter-associated beta strand protein
LTTTDSNIEFSSTVDPSNAGDALTISIGTGDVTFDDAIGGSTAFGDVTITAGNLVISSEFNAPSSTVSLTISSAATDGASDTGYITTQDIKFYGTGTYGFSNANNDADTLTAGTNSVSVGGVTFHDTNTLILGTAGSTSSTPIVYLAGDMTLSADDDILINDAIRYTDTSTSTLTITAGDDLMLNEAITSTSGKLNITASSSTSSGGYLGIEGDLTTEGGAISLSGYLISVQGTSAQTFDTSRTGVTGGNIDFNNALQLGITDSGSASELTLTTGGGAVTFDSTVNSASSITRQYSTASTISLAAQGTSGWSSTATRTYNDGTNGSETIVCCFNNTLSYNTINDLNNTALTVTFNWYRVDSWDNQEPFKIIVNGTTIFNSTFNYASADLSQTNSGYTTSFTNRVSSGTGGDYIRYGNGNAGWVDSSFLVTITTPAIDSFAMTLDADNMQSASDESYGVRDFAYTGGTDGTSTSSISTNTGLVISADAGDITFSDAVGGSKALNDVTLTGAQINTDAITLATNEALNITNTGTSEIAGVLAGSGATLTKAGAGTLTLSGTNTYTGQTNVNAGTLAVTVNDALGTNAAGTVIASGATLRSYECDLLHH